MSHTRFNYKAENRCLLDEFKDKPQANVFDGQCRGEELGYRADLTVDKNGKKIIECSNKIGSCRRSICECDKALAEKLAKYEDTWDETLHANKGTGIVNRAGRNITPFFHTPPTPPS